MSKTITPVDQPISMKTWTIQCRARRPAAMMPRPWEDFTPGVTYSMEELRDFELTLTFEDWRCSQWRAVGNGTSIPLDARFGLEKEDDDPPVHRIVKLDVAGGECLPPTGWEGMLHQLGALARRVGRPRTA
jgi:hypothetical protein